MRIDHILLLPIRNALQSSRIVVAAGAISILLAAVYLRSTWNFNRDTSKRTNKRPPLVPYWFPGLYHLVPLAWDPATFIAKTVERYGSSAPLEIRLGWLRVCIVSNPRQVQDVLRSSKWLSSTPGILYTLENVFGASKKVIAVHANDDSGMATKPRKGSKTKPEERIHFLQATVAQQQLSGESLIRLSNRYMDILKRNIDALEIGTEWIELTDLYSFLQTHVAGAAVESLMGSHILRIHPTFVEDFWKFDNHTPSFIRGIPRWLMLGAYKVRDKLVRSIMEWHESANQHSDCSKFGPDDIDWDPYFGTKIMKARQHYALRIPTFGREGAAMEDFGLTWAANTNVVPCVFWYIFEALRSSTLQRRLLAEALESRLSPGRFDIAALSSGPLLQSGYAEVLRLRVAIATIRQSEYSDFPLDSYSIPEKRIMILFSRTAALSREAWSVRPHTIEKPLTEFWADRFLVTSGDAQCGSRQEESSAEETAAARSSSSTDQTRDGAEKVDVPRPQFSLEGLGGCWLPYGGGQRMCPGRHFAKNEMIGTFAFLLSEYEIEFTSPECREVQPDLRFFPMGGLPPRNKVPVRIRKRMTAM